MKHRLDPLFEKLGITAKNKDVYDVALTHSSFNAVSNRKHQDYERLEFLGDSVVGMVVSELCYRYHPEMQQGDLSILKSQFIRTESEAGFALSVGLGSFLRTGPSYCGNIGDNYSMLEDIFESFIGALYLDQGKDFAYDFVYKLFEKPISHAKIEYEENPKSELQEAIQADARETVSYRLLKEEGPSNNKTYLMGVYLMDIELGRGSGRSKKEAETAAAKDALAKRAFVEVPLEE